MLICFILLLIFMFIGYPLTPKGTNDRLLLAPVMGISISVLLGYFISMNLRITGADAMALSFLLLGGIGCVVSLRSMRGKAKIHDFSKFELSSVALAILPVIILIAPALFIGLENFFGVVNFDFFYNSRDSLYLATHSVLEYSVTNEPTIFPLNWSADQQGRFAVTLIAAFASKYFHLNPLHFNACLIPVLMMTASLTATVFARRVLGLGYWFSCLASSVFILSAGFAQGYIYYLLGQISAIPVFIAICVFTNDLLIKLKSDIPARTPITRDVLLLALLLNALYIFYTIMALYALAFIAIAVCINAFKDKDLSLRKYSPVIAASFLTIVVFFCARMGSLVETKNAFIDWIALSLKTAGQAKAQDIIHFSEYLTEAGQGLVLGIFVFPTNNSVVTQFLSNTPSKNIVFLSIGVFSFLCLALSFVIIMREKSLARANKSVLASIALLTLASAVIFYYTRSGYALFKIGSWFVPIILMVSVASLWYSRHSSLPYRIPAQVMLVFLVSMNAISALNYSYVFFDETYSGKFSNLAYLNGLEGVGTLNERLQSSAQKELIFDFSDGRKAAWISNDLSDHTVTAITHNYQPLVDRLLPESPCGSIEKPDFSHSLLVRDRQWIDNTDIITIHPSHDPVYSNQQYFVYEGSAIDQYAFLGRGTYPAYTLTQEVAEISGFPLTFRWVEKGVELYIYSKRPSTVDLSFDVAPGYVAELEKRTLHVQGPNVDELVEFKHGPTSLEFKSIQIPEGMSCFLIVSPDKVERLSRPGSLFRADIQSDNRLLNFAFGNVVINFHQQNGNEYLLNQTNTSVKNVSTE